MFIAFPYISSWLRLFAYKFCTPLCIFISINKLSNSKCKWKIYTKMKISNFVWFEWFWLCFDIIASVYMPLVSIYWHFSRKNKKSSNIWNHVRRVRIAWICIYTCEWQVNVHGIHVGKKHIWKKEMFVIYKKMHTRKPQTNICIL